MSRIDCKVTSNYLLDDRAVPPIRPVTHGLRSAGISSKSRPKLGSFSSGRIIRIIFQSAASADHATLTVAERSC